MTWESHLAQFVKKKPKGKAATQRKGAFPRKIPTIGEKKGNTFQRTRKACFKINWASGRMTAGISEKKGPLLI